MLQEYQNRLIRLRRFYEQKDNEHERAAAKHHFDRILEKAKTQLTPKDFGRLILRVGVIGEESSNQDSKTRQELWQDIQAARQRFRIDIVV